MGVSPMESRYAAAGACTQAQGKSGAFFDVESKKRTLRSIDFDHEYVLEHGGHTAAPRARRPCHVNSTHPRPWKRRPAPGACSGISTFSPSTICRYALRY